MSRRCIVNGAIFSHLFLVYISWGSTYLGLELALQVMGSFFSCGLRMAIAGILIYCWLRLQKKWVGVSAAHVRHAAVSGLFLVVCASGFLCVGQQYIPSGVASIVSGSTPLSMILISWLFAGEKRPSLTQFAGLLGGFAALVLLSLDQCTGPKAGSEMLLGIFWVFLATLGWVCGSLMLRKTTRAETLPPMQDCALLLFLGGVECLIIGMFCGEANSIHLENLRPGVVAAFLWMVVGGSILAYSSYFWLLRHVRLSVAISYEYVVPIIALFLGWWLLDETITTRMLFAVCLALGSVGLVISHQKAG